VRTLWHTFRALPGWLRALLIGQFVNAAGALAWVFLTLYLVDNRHISTAHAGLLTAANGVGLIAGNLVGGWVGDRIGLRRALLIGLFGWAVTCSVVPWTPVPVLGPLLLVAGTLGGFARPLMSAVVLGALPTEQRRTGAALWRVAFNAGAIIGPPLGALAAGRHFGVIFLVDAVSSLMLAGVILRFAQPDGPRRSRHERAAQGRLWDMLRHDRFAVAVLLTVIVVDTCYRQLYVGLPLELHRLHAPTVVYGLTVTVNCVLIVVAEVWVAQRFAHRSPAAVIAAGYVAVALSWLLFGAYPGVVTAMAMVAVISVGEMLYKPTATAAVADSAPGGFEGRYQSLYAGASISGTVFAPAIGGALFQHHTGLLWLITGLAPLAAAAYLLPHTGRPQPAPDEALVGGGAGVESVGDLGGA
jgi:MFS family permease